MLQRHHERLANDVRRAFFERRRRVRIDVHLHTYSVQPRTESRPGSAPVGRTTNRARARRTAAASAPCTVPAAQSVRRSHADAGAALRDEDRQISGNDIHEAVVLAVECQRPGDDQARPPARRRTRRSYLHTLCAITQRQIDRQQSRKTAANLLAAPAVHSGE